MRETLGRCLTRARACTWYGVRVVMRFAWCWWVPLSAVFIAGIGVCLTVHFWDWLAHPQESPSATIRNASLVIAAPVALVLAVWRSIIAQKQADTAEKNLINEQFKFGVELLGHESAAVRLGGISTLNVTAELYLETLYERVMKLFETFLTYPPRFESDQGEHKKGEVDYGSRDILEILRIMKARTSQQCKKHQFSFPPGAAFVATKNEVKPNKEHLDYEKWEANAPRYVAEMMASALMDPITSQAVVKKRPPEGPV